MTSIIGKALNDWLRATLRPRRALRELVAESEPIGIALWINVIFALLYAVTALVYHAIGRLPAVEPWMPIVPESYYLYQVFWPSTLPGGAPSDIRDWEAIRAWANDLAEKLRGAE